MPTVIHRLAKWAKEQPTAAAQKYKVGTEWKTITAGDYAERVFHLALFLESKGFGAGQIGCILSYNCPQWVHTDLAFMLVGGKSTGLYPNSITPDINYIVDHTEATVLAVQNKTYFDKLVGTNNEHPVADRIKLIIMFDGDTSVSDKAVGYQDALDEGRKLAQGKNMEDYLARLKADEAAFLIYTSGTTAKPKGALISHRNLIAPSDGAIDFWRLNQVEPKRMFCFLPLCHIAEKLHTIGVGIASRFTVFYCSKFDNLAAELGEVQPTVLLCVPRVWEKMKEGVETKLGKATGTKKKLADWAMALGKKRAEAKYDSKASWGITDAIQYRLAKKLVLDKVKKALGLGSAKLVASGAAALSPHVIKWFRIFDLNIMNTLGQTEGGLITMQDLNSTTLGTVGVPAPGVEFKIAEDGEIVCKTPGVFKGYFKNDEATRNTVIDGWLHTGDLGARDESGEIFIKGRKKEIMKSSGGKMVAPLPIEEELKASPLISQVCMVGDGRKYFSALITIADDRLKSLAGNNGSSIDGEIVKDEQIRSEVQASLDELNSHLSNYEQIKYFTVLSKEFSIETGEMTPTMKMKRNVIEDRYKNVIDKMYN